MCLVCQLNPDVKCSKCKKTFCGDCWKYDPNIRTIDKGCDHNAPYMSIGYWDWDSYIPYNNKNMTKKQKNVSSKDGVEAWFDLEPSDEQWDKVAPPLAYPLNTDEEISVPL
jgi:hypothetical protein